MKVTILGCGTSTGVPKIGNEWGRCDPNEPRNRRTRSSILVESGGKRLLVGCGPDLGQQLLAADTGRIDAVLLTHDHADHCHGIDDLRPLAQANGGPLPFYARAGDIERVEQRFGYAFATNKFYPPVLTANALGDRLHFGALEACFVEQPHGGMTSLGIRFDEGERSLGYAVDFNDFTEEMASLYQGVDVLIADCLTRAPHPTHAYLDGVLGWARDCRVGHLYLTHMGNGLDYRTLCDELPDWAEPAHDQLEIVIA